MRVKGGEGRHPKRAGRTRGRANANRRSSKSEQRRGSNRRDEDLDALLSGADSKPAQKRAEEEFPESRGLGRRGKARM